MEKENIETNQSVSAITPEQTNNVQEAQALIELKKQMERLQRENNDLLEAKKTYYDSVINGNIATSEESPTFRSSLDVRAELKRTANDNTNLRNAELYVELNDAVIREGGESIFLPKGRNVTPTYEEQELAERFPKVLKECIEVANGDAGVFNSEFKRHTR